MNHKVKVSSIDVSIFKTKKEADNYVTHLREFFSGAIKKGAVIVEYAGETDEEPVIRREQQAGIDEAQAKRVAEDTTGKVCKKGHNHTSTEHKEACAEGVQSVGTGAKQSDAVRRTTQPGRQVPVPKAARGESLGSTKSTKASVQSAAVGRKEVQSEGPDARNPLRGAPADHKASAFRKGSADSEASPSGSEIPGLTTSGGGGGGHSSGELAHGAHSPAGAVDRREE